MAEPLFRPEVYAARVERELGRVRLGAARHAWALALLLLSITIAGGTYLSMATYTRGVGATGYLAPAAAASPVLVEQPGFVVLDVHVRDGDRVAAGDALVTVGRPLAIAADTSRATAVSLARRAEENVTAALARLERTRRSVDAALAVALEGAELDAARLAARERQLAEVRRLRAQRLSLARSRTEAFARLRRQRVISELDWLEHESEILALEEALGSVEGELVATGRLREAQVLKLAEHRLARDARVLELDAERDALRQRVDEVRAASRRVLIAPVAGTVDALQVHEGAAVPPGSPLLRVLPVNDALIAKLLIPGSAMAFVAPGRRVRLRFDALPHQHFGTVGARLVQVSRSVAAAADVLGPYAPREPVYLAQAELDVREPARSSERPPLRDGMRFEAVVELERRTLLAWLLEPLRTAVSARAS